MHSEEFRPQEHRAYEDLLRHLPLSLQRFVDFSMSSTPSTRHYHAKWHLGRMWRLHREHGPRSWDHEIAIDIAFHDVVNIPGAAPASNEIKSLMALLECASWGSEPELAKILRLKNHCGRILATADHLGSGWAITEENDPVGGWFLDLDLEPIASSDFQENTQLLRREHQFATDEAFEKGRINFLMVMNAAPKIYRTATAASLGWERVARANIARELDLHMARMSVSM